MLVTCELQELGRHGLMLRRCLSPRGRVHRFIGILLSNDMRQAARYTVPRKRAERAPSRAHGRKTLAVKSLPGIAASTASPIATFADARSIVIAPCETRCRSAITLVVITSASTCSRTLFQALASTNAPICLLGEGFAGIEVAAAYSGKCGDFACTVTARHRSMRSRACGEPSISWGGRTSPNSPAQRDPLSPRPRSLDKHRLLDEAHRRTARPSPFRSHRHRQLP